MADIFERLLKNYGPIGQHRERAHGYFAFPKLEGEIGSRMKFRGQDVGTKVLKLAEDIARERGCIGLWLDTYWFQARSFYEKQGYEVFGELPDYPHGGPRYFLKKSLV